MSRARTAVAMAGAMIFFICGCSDQLMILGLAGLAVTYIALRGEGNGNRDRGN